MVVDWEEMQKALERFENKDETENPMLNVIKIYGKDSSEYQSAVQGYGYGSEERNNEIAKHFIKFLLKMAEAQQTLNGQEYLGYSKALKHIEGFVREELDIKL